MTRRPNKVKVGPFTYEIATDDKACDDAEADGVFQTKRARIVVRSGLDVQVERSVLLHELLHGCVNAGGKDEEGLKHEHEEAAVVAMTNGLLHMLRSNPQLVAWLTQKDDS